MQSDYACKVQYLTWLANDPQVHYLASDIKVILSREWDCNRAKHY
jgi:hypothetical protein